MKYTAYDVRKTTDSLFDPKDGSIALQGLLDKEIRFVEEKQLLDADLWALFVEQFRIGDVDDFDCGWRSEYWGKMMRGACFTYSYTQNEKLYTILENTVRDLITTQDKYGRISAYSIPNEFRGWDVWGRKYVILGVEYFLEICKDDSLADEALNAIKKQADYIICKIGRDEIGKMPITNTSDYWQGLNASSLLEPIVRLYLITKEKKYYDFALDIIETGGMKHFNLFESALEGKVYPYQYPVTKAYEMMSNFEGIIEFYRATGEEKYKTMALNFARLVIESDVTVIGSCGTTHELFDHSKVTQFDPSKNMPIMQETCVTVTWIKFLHQLLCITANPIYADEIEKSIYNCLSGSINFYGNETTLDFNQNPIPPQTYTFDSYSPLLNGVRGNGIGGRKDLIHGQFFWGCCVAIGAAGTGLIASSSMMTKKNGVAVNLYIPGNYSFSTESGNNVSLNMATNYPVDGNIVIKVSTDKTEKFDVSLRIPAWSKKNSMTVNGTKIDVNAGEYAVINRVWSNGDVIELCLDMRNEIIYASALDPDADEQSKCHFALRHGPLMLARDSRLGEEVTEAVTILDNDGYAEVETLDDVPFEHIVGYKVKTDKGYFKVVDYSSAGQIWHKPMTVWMTSEVK